MSDAERTLLEIVRHIIDRHRSLSDRLETIAAAAQGKGFGSFTIHEEVTALWSLIEARPAIAIDIGGNVGDYSAEILNRCSSTEVHIFEPSHVNISLLRERFQQFDNVRVVPKALSSKSGRATLFSDKAGSGLASLTHRQLDHFSIEFNHTEIVDTMRFDEYWVSQLQKRQIDIVKIDTEGHELDVLNGFGEALSVSKIIQFEFGGANIDTRTFFRDYWQFFTRAQFELYRITPDGLSPIRAYRESDEFFSTTNYIAVNKSG